MCSLGIVQKLMARNLNRFDSFEFASGKFGNFFHCVSVKFSMNKFYVLLFP